VIGRPLLLLAAGAVTAGAGLLTVRDGADGAAPVGVDGAALFQAKGCAACHDGPDGRSPVGIGPPLDDVSAWAADRIAGTSAGDYVRQSIVAPQAFRSPAAHDGGAEMPALAVGPDELDALVAYLLDDPAG
jgi:mono/diheme cytochrome c family protein